MAADGYRFHLQPDGRIRSEIPSLHEVVEGCVSAWKKDPSGGVIGVQKGPLW